MTRLLILVLTVGLILGYSSPSSAFAQGFRGLALSTPYPSQTVRAGEPVTLTLTVRNFGLPPQVVTLQVVALAPRWKVSFLGGGRPVTAVYVAPDQETSVSLRLEPPEGTRPGAYRFRLLAEGQTARAELPLTVTLGQILPSRLDLRAELPVLRGTATSSFRYRLTLKNDSDRDLLVNLEGQGPGGFQASFTPAFGSQQVTSLPVKAAESRDIDAEVTLPRQVPAGDYEVIVRAAAGEARAEVKLGLSITGRPDLSLATPEGRLSGRAYAGTETPIKLVVKNQGTVPARNVEFSSSEPSGWEVKFAPQRIDQILPNAQQETTAIIKPSGKAIAGDYVVTLRASGGEASASADFRVTVLTSTLWGLVGIVLVAIALGGVTLAVSRYGRR